MYIHSQKETAHIHANQNLFLSHFIITLQRACINDGEAVGRSWRLAVVVVRFFILLYL